MSAPRRLVLIRHAKAADGPADHERRLAPRGERDAAGIGRWLAAHDTAPDAVVVSTALRTRQTWAGCAGELSDPCVPDFDDRIYEATVEDLLDVVHEAGEESSTVVLVGHNPGMQELAIYLDSSAGTSALGQRVRSHFPTSTVVVIGKPPLP